MRQTFKQIVGAIFALTLIGCGSADENLGAASLQVKIPAQVQSKAMKSFLATEANGFQAPANQDIWSSSIEPTETGELNCFGVVVGGPDIDLQGNKCRDNNTGAEFAFGRSAMGAGLGDVITLEGIPAGQDREITIIAWRANSGEACKSLRPGKKVDVANLSHPFVIGRVRTNLQPGNQSVAIDASFNPSKKLLNCDIFDPDQNSQSVFQELFLSGSATGIEGPTASNLKFDFFKNGEKVGEIDADGNGSGEFGNEEGPTPYSQGDTYRVEITQQPTLHNCTVQNGIGTFGNQNIDNVRIVCQRTGFKVNVQVNGLPAAGLQETDIVVNRFRDRESGPDTFACEDQSGEFGGQGVVGPGFSEDCEFFDTLFIRNNGNFTIPALMPGQEGFFLDAFQSRGQTGQDGDFFCEIREPGNEPQAEGFEGFVDNADVNLIIDCFDFSQET